MRTLVISDLHLGARPGVAVLEDPEARRALTERLADVDRLVLLGDTIELRRGSLRQALQAATPVLADLGAALGSGKEVVLLPGNHDHRLLGPWRERRAVADSTGPLGLETSVDWRPDEPLAVLADALGPAQVSVSYPGVWLRPDLYAIHGHYLDLHITVPIMERVGAGLMARLLGGQAATPDRVEDYEAVLSPMYAWVDTVAEVATGTALGVQGRVWNGLQRRRRRRSLRQHATALVIPTAVAAMNRFGLGPVRSDLSGPELRRSALAAFDQVLDRLGVRARYVIFGHTHRAGPLPEDERGEWRSSAGGTMLNSGCWVYAAFFLGNSPGTSPYRAGFGYLIEDDGPPELINLLDGTGWQPVLRPARG